MSRLAILVIKLGALGDFVQAMGPAAAIRAHHPDAETVVMPGVGHALFVDDAGGFDSILQSFIRRRIWH